MNQPIILRKIEGRKNISSSLIKRKKLISESKQKRQKTKKNNHLKF